MDIHVTIDFPDDLWFATRRWDEASLRSLIRFYAEHGVTGIHWIDYGTIDDGLFDRGTYLDRMGTARDFITAVPDPLRVVADEGRRLGMRVYSVLKIFDLCGEMPWSTLPAGAGRRVGTSFIGGEGVHAHRWIRDHPRLRAELHPSLRERTPRLPVSRLRLWHEGPALPSCGFRLLTSADNRDYRPYGGPQRIEIGERRRRPPVFAPAPARAFGPEAMSTCIEFSGLAIDAPFIAIETEGCCVLANTLEALVELEDVAGNAVAFTLGLIPVVTPENRRPDWKTAGIAFDAAFGTSIPGRGWTDTRSGGRFRHELAPRGFLGIARGRNEHLAGIVELAYPEVREWLVGLAIRAAEAGCDGVDVRTTTHTESLDFENYGFGPPIVEAMRARHGVDIGSDGFDRAAWRRLRGSFLDLLLAQMREALHRRGKSLIVQLASNFDKPAEETCFHEIHVDWRRWCRERAFDIANLIAFRFAGTFYWDAIAACRESGIPLMMTPSMHAASDEVWATEGRELLEHCLADGIGTFNIYESGYITRLEERGFAKLHPPLWALVEEFRSRPGG
ncbi:MAG TPA: hypothetical protein VEL07_02395 [Planctomycetota bacterium]|nr:hypothetical protein [Planctomycetota bacterium]